MIREGGTRGEGWQVIVYVGRDPMTGKQLRESGRLESRTGTTSWGARSAE
jgi:hypothetical protein